MKRLAILVLLCIGFSSNAQVVNVVDFSYDAGGNRIERIASAQNQTYAEENDKTIPYDWQSPGTAMLDNTRDGDTYYVGEIPYSENITLTGAVTYNVPIAVSPDASFPPSASLCYNSQGGNGIAGYGWSIGGLSSIVVRNKNFYYDHEVAPADIYADYQVYSLDGQPLVRNGLDTLATEYPLATANGKVLVNRYNYNGFAAYFTALYPDGTKWTYGFTNSRFRHFMFPVTRVEDRFGNYIEYNYDNYTFPYRISTIQYYQHGAQAPVGTISFEYSHLPDYCVTYYAGQSSSHDYLLTGITTEDETSVLRRYSLRHETENTLRYQYLTNVLTAIECRNGADGELRPLRFTYGESPREDDPHLVINSDFSLSAYFSQDQAGFLRYIRGKFNPGSYTDGLIALPNLDTYGIVYSHYENIVFGGIYPALQQILLIPSLEETNGYVSLMAEDGFQTIEPVDIDNDGVDELVKINMGVDEISHSTTLTIKTYRYADNLINQIGQHVISIPVAIGSGEYISPMEMKFFFGDFVGKGESQLLAVSYNQDRLGRSMISKTVLVDLNTGRKLYNGELISLSPSANNVFCADINNDGKTEICVGENDELCTYGYQDALLFSASHMTGMPSSHLTREYFLTDINGDGYLDILSPVGFESWWSADINTGNSFYSIIMTICEPASNKRYMFYDLNKDGLYDLVTHDGANLDIFLNEYGQLDESRCIRSNLVLAPSADFVGCNVVSWDSMSSFVIVDGPSVKAYGFSENLLMDRLMTKMESSLGLTRTFDYSNLSSNSGAYIYNGRAYNNADGYHEAQFPLPIVSGTKKYLSPSVLNDEMISIGSYTYYDACMNTLGLGYCGFGKVETIEHVTVGGKKPMSITELDPEKMGVVTSVTMSHAEPQSRPYSMTTYTYDDHTTTYGKLNPRLIEMTQVDSLTTISSTTTYIYDSFDFPTKVTTSKSLAGEETHREVQSLSYIHSLSPSRYILGSVSSVTDTKSIQLSIRPPFPAQEDTLMNQAISPLQNEWVVRSDYTYDDKMQPLSQTSYVGALAFSMSKTNTTLWTYDSWGNILSEESAPYTSTTFVGSQFTYDAYGLRLSSSTNELGQTTTYSNYKFGIPRMVENYAGRTTVNIVNDWGEVTLVARPYGVVSTTSKAWGGPGAYMVTSSTTGQPTTEICYDALNREIRSGSRQFNGQNLYVDTEYERNGLLKRTSEPYFEGSAAFQWNSYTYDEYGRPIRFAKASGNNTLWSYDANRTTTTQDGVWSSKTVDANGNVVLAEDAGGTISYTLRLDGQPSSVSVTGGGVIIFTYDKYGRRTKVEDPSAGTQSTAYQMLSGGNSLVTLTTPKGTISTRYDKFGRVTKVTRNGDYNTDYGYDSASGLLVSKTATNGTLETYTYDIYDRLLSHTQYAPDNIWLRKSLTYSSGNIASTTYESQDGTIATESYSYSNGTLSQISVANDTILKLQAINNYGQPTQVKTGGVTRTYAYSYGLPTQRTMGNVMSYSYTYNYQTGNVTTVFDNIRTRVNAFSYDSLNRLTGQLQGPSSTYGSNGNMLTYGGAGSMKYEDGDHPYQMTGVNPANARVPTAEQNVTYNSASRPSAIEQDEVIAVFTYGCNDQRVKMIVTDPAHALLTRYYLGQYEVDITPSGTTQRLYLGGNAYSAPMVYVKNGNGPWTLYNIGRDNVGSITHIASANGTLVEENRFNAWGRRMNPQTGNVYAPGTEPQLMLGRGFSGHEHLDWFTLINMNARLYDPTVCRFLSPDPYIQIPDFTQSYNAYAYCLNNPLRYTDESGEIWGLVAGAVIGGVSNWMTNGCEFSWRGLGYFGVGALMGFISSGASALTVTAIGTCGVFAGAAIGAAIGGFGSFTSTFVSHGLNNILSGNDFMDGTWSAALKAEAVGALSGAFSGGIAGGRIALQSGKNVWWGNSTKPGTSQWSLFNIERPQVYKSHVFDNYGKQNGECVLRCLEEFSESYGDYSNDYDYWFQQNDNKLGVSPNSVTELINGSGVYGSEELMCCPENIINAFNNDQRVMFGFNSGSGNHAVMMYKIKLWSNGTAKLYFRETSPVSIVDASVKILPNGLIPRYIGARMWSFFKL